MLQAAAGVLIAALAIGAPAARACDGDGDAVGATSVSDVYPTADLLPENLLRFYIYFSAPMARDSVSAAITLSDSGGAPIPGVFLSNHHALWSPDGRRLTLILDPGRVKTGLDAHEAMGRALTAGERYTLMVDASALDVAGCRLSSTFTKAFLASEADVTLPNIHDWRLASPSAGTRETLELHLNGPHDHVSLAHRIRVRDLQGTVVAGAIALANHEQTWRFTPRAPWRAQDYAIIVDTTLEDIAGNRVTGLFDRPTTDLASNPEEPGVVTLSFTPARAPAPISAPPAGQP